jgi:hypothetical protein
VSLTPLFSLSLVSFKRFMVINNPENFDEFQ